LVRQRSRKGVIHIEVAHIVISEFMDEVVMRRVFSSRSVLYDPSLAEHPEQLLAAGPNLRAIGRLGVGLDNINLDACMKRGIAVYPAKGGPDVSVAEYVITATLVLLRGAWFGTDAVLAGAWPRTELIGHEICGKRLGLVGFGATARQTASRAKSLGMEVAAVDPGVEAGDPAWSGIHRLSLDALLRTSDVVSLHIPLTPETRHIIDEQRLRAMKPGSVLINASRGGTVDEQALVSALKSGHLAAAALDVFEAEPLNKARAARFVDVPNLILTPHIAGLTHEANVRVSEIVATAIANHLATSD